MLLGLGTWQLQRLYWKEGLLADIAERTTSAPASLHDVEQRFAATHDVDYWPVEARGTFLHAGEQHYFATHDGKSGFFLYTPLQLGDGRFLFVNRGFVPQQYQEAAAIGDLHGEDPGMVTITGLFREPEAAGMMTPEANMSDRIEWVRDPARMALMADPNLAPIAPFYVDLPATMPGELPQGGETVITFPNNHFGYALTWYGFSIVAVVMLGFWLWRQRRPLANYARRSLRLSRALTRLRQF